MFVKWFLSCCLLEQNEDKKNNRKNKELKWTRYTLLHNILSSDLFDMCVAKQQQLMMKAWYEALAKKEGAQAVKKVMLKRAKESEPE